MLNACIIDTVYPTLADLHKAGKNLVNRLSQEVELKVSGSEGVLSNGSKIKKDGDFKHSHSRPNMAVYLLEGPIPTNGKEVKRMHGDDKKGKTEGGAEVSESRFVFAKRIEEDFCMMQVTEYHTNNTLKANPYVTAVGNLVHFLAKNSETYSSEHAAVMKLLSPNAVSSFYILFEPYSSSPSVLGASCFSDFVKNAMCKDPVEAIVSCLNANKDSFDGSFGALQSLRDKVFSSATINTVNTAINSIYSDKRNLARDEFREMVDNSELFGSRFDMQAFREFTYLAMTKYNFSNPEKQVSLTNSLNGVIRPQVEYFSGPYRFVRSSNFGYFPCSEENMGKLGNSPSSNEDPTASDLINHYAKNWSYLKDCQSNCSAAASAELDSLKAKIACCE